VYVSPSPKTDFTVNDTSQCLHGNSFTFTDNSSIKLGSITQYNFNLGDGTYSSLSSISHNYFTTDTFFVKLVTNSNQGCSDSVTKEMYVRPMPVAAFSINTNPQNLPANNFVFTSTSTIPSGNIKYHWDFGDGDTSALSNPLHSYISVGSYKVILITTSDYGCADTFTDSVFVIMNPGIVVSFTTNNACVGEEVLFINTSTLNPPDSFLNFFWDFGDGNQTIVLNDPKHIYSSAGTYYITLEVLTAYGFKDTLTDTIEIYPTPTVDITAVPDTIAIPGKQITLTASGSYDQLIWSDNSTGSSIIVSTEGRYWVVATYNNGCKSSDTIDLVKGEMKEVEVMNVITPNGDGYNDMLIIKNIYQIQPCKLAIYNRWGDELYTSQDYQNNWDGTYKGKKLPEGSYYYFLETKEGRLVKGAVNIINN
jgi:gliding motility-associated-like protein